MTLDFELQCLQKAYSKNIVSIDSSGKNPIVKVQGLGGVGDLFWIDGRLLPETEIQNASNYERIFSYKYQKHPKRFDELSKEEVETILENARPNNVKKSLTKSIYFLFNIIYDSYSKRTISKHIKESLFLGKKVKVHENIIPILNRIENKILNSSSLEFLPEIYKASGYIWRVIAGTNNRSFHSFGIAIDLLPKEKCNIYWRWTQGEIGDLWLSLPLEKRWLVPSEIVEIFAEEGFIWGGNWNTWDNMHFEYRPELLLV